MAQFHGKVSKDGRVILSDVHGTMDYEETEGQFQLPEGVHSLPFGGYQLTLNDGRTADIMAKTRYGAGQASAVTFTVSGPFQ